eukprot:2220369-Rhodomonas_salina.1
MGIDARCVGDLLGGTHVAPPSSCRCVSRRSPTRSHCVPAVYTDTLFCCVESELFRVDNTIDRSPRNHHVVSEPRRDVRQPAHAAVAPLPPGLVLPAVLC